MRFSAISSRVKSCVSISTLEGSLVRVAGRIGAGTVDVLQRKTLPKDSQKEDEVPGIEATFKELARSTSTAALRRYAIADGVNHYIRFKWQMRRDLRSVVCMML